MHQICTIVSVTLCVAGIAFLEVSNAEFSINRTDIIRRSKFWNILKIPYDQQKFLPAYSEDELLAYRTDCSGFVSMAWKLNMSMNTKTLLQVSTLISKEDLLPGDIILKPGVHVLIFEKWADKDKTSYWAYDQTPPANKHHVIKRYPYFGRSGYAPYRYIGVPEDKTHTGKCACPESPLNLYIHNAAQSIYCKSEMVGNCDETGLYYCYYLNNYNNNAGTMSLLHTCKEECHNPYYGKGNARCLNEDFVKIMEKYVGKRQRRSAALEIIGEIEETPEVRCDDLQFKTNEQNSGTNKQTSRKEEQNNETDKQNSGTFRQLPLYHLIAYFLLIRETLKLVN